MVVLIEQEQKKKGYFGGSNFNISPEIKEFRQNCWRSIFGEDLDYDDPIEEFLWQQIDEQGIINADIYRVVFFQAPDDTQISFDIYKD